MPSESTTTLTDDIKELLANEQDLEFEQEISRNPFSLKAWLRYLGSKSLEKRKERYVLYERALKFLPRSYKLWYAYLQERYKAIHDRVDITHKKYQILINTYERAFVHMSKMPRIWVDYCQLLVDLKKGTFARKTFDRALQALPITQHHRIWEIYLPWAKDIGVKETAMRVYRRFLKYDASYREEYVDYLEAQGEIGEAAQQLAICVNDDMLISPKGTTKHALWMRLCDMCAKHPLATSQRLKVDAIIRSGLARFTDEVGTLWCKLADYYIRLSQFERARDVYEEGINSVVTVRDFTRIFDAYAKFEEELLTARVTMLEEGEDEEEDEDGEKLEDDLDVDGDDTELRLARLEDLMERRPILLSSVLLRQNPHNVHEWHKRVKLFKDDPVKVIRCFTEAVKTVDPRKAVGKPHTLWLSFARFYEDHEDLDNARVILDKATAVDYKHVDELAIVYCSWAEMELRHENYDEALEVMQRAVTEPSESVMRRRQNEAIGRSLDKQKAQADVPVQEKVYRSTKVWSLYLDLEESLGTVETAKAAYDRVLELKVATPQMILNFAAFLEENKYFEESFRVYEKGVGVFGFPHVKPIWTKYLDKFVARYGGTKLERARDLFEQCLEKVPKKDAAAFYIKYAKLEEDFGLARHALAIYDRATQAVDDSQKYDMFLLYVKKVESLYGVIKTREVYEKAIEVLPDESAKLICIEYAELERKLGEIDRARAIYTHGGQFADPRRDTVFWVKWNDFEIAHGNEDTFREMLRVKRSVQTLFSQVNYTAAEMISGETLTSDAEALARDKAKAVAPQQPVGGAGGPGEGPSKKRKAEGAIEADLEAVDRQAKRIQAVTKGNGAVSVNVNPEEIDIDEEEEEDGGPEEEGSGAGRLDLKEKPVPASVFSGLGLKEGGADGADGGQAKGALERLKGKKGE